MPPYDEPTAARVRAALTRRAPRPAEIEPAKTWSQRVGDFAKSLGQTNARPVTPPTEDLAERRMFGGIAFLRSGHMCMGVHGSSVIARVGPDRHRAALGQRHARPFDLTGKAMTGFVFVDPAGFESAEDLGRWVDWCVEFVDSLPAKG